MEFKAIIDAKARNDAGCAVVGVYEDADLGIAAARIDKQLDGLIGKLRGEGIKFLEQPYQFGDTRAVMIEGPSREALELVEIK